ncbi:MAG: hypothetical protein NC394_07945 [Bacteroides sp.]|nr:hypothetical protein [Bacteroides sp.]
MEKTATLFLPTDNLLNRCGAPLDGEDSERIFSYASFAVKKMLREWVKPYGKLKLSVFEGIFSGTSSISEIVAKKYAGCSQAQQKGLMYCTVLDEICKGKPVFLFPLSEEKGKYRLLPPVRLSVALEGGAEGLEKIAAALKRSLESKRSYPLIRAVLPSKRKELIIKAGAAAMKLSEGELAFVTRFNEETFFKNVPMKPFEGGRPELSDKSLLTAFAALYAITFFGLSFRDIYAVEEVFGFSDKDIRKKDLAKHEAALRLSEEIGAWDGRALSDNLQKMGEALLRVPLPEINVKNFLVLAENYVFYNAVSDMGRAYIKAAESVDNEKSAQALKRAALMEDHRYAARLCEELAAMTESGAVNILRARSRKKAEETRKRAERERADEREM